MVCPEIILLNGISFSICGQKILVVVVVGIQSYVLKAPKMARKNGCDWDKSMCSFAAENGPDRMDVLGMLQHVMQLEIVRHLVHIF